MTEVFVEQPLASPGFANKLLCHILCIMIDEAATHLASAPLQGVASVGTVQGACKY